MTIWWHSKYSKWHRTSSRAEAYPYLFAAGSWQNLFLYRGHTWNAEICAVMPHTCELLLPEIPTKPGLPYVMPNNEEIVLFRSVGGAYVGPHTGAVNNQINIHLTLKGGTGVYLEVGSSVSNRSRFRFFGTFGVLFLYFLQLGIQGRWGKGRIASWQSRVLSGRRAAPAHAFAVCEPPLIHLVWWLLWLFTCFHSNQRDSPGFFWTDFMRILKDFLCLCLFEYIGSRTATYIAWSMMMKAKRGSHWCLCSNKCPVSPHHTNS